MSSGNWTTGTISQNDENFRVKGWSNLGFTNTGTTTAVINGYPVLPGGSFTVTTGTALENERITIRFTGEGSKNLAYSTVIQSLCACKK